MAYHNYMTKIAIILGADPATVADDMQEVLDFETLLANVRKKYKSNTIDNKIHSNLLIKIFFFFLKSYFKLKASLSEIERHDTSSVYHKLTLTSLKALVPQIKWDVYMRVSTK